MSLSNNLHIARIKLSFNKYFDILGCISSSLILLLTSNVCVFSSNEFLHNFLSPPHETFSIMEKTCVSAVSTSVFVNSPIFFLCVF